MHRNEPRPLNWRNLPVSPSSFCLCIIRDTEFSPEPLVFLVYNNADSEKTTGGRQKKGKPPGFGMPGGGVNIGDMDTIYGAAERELEYETGLTGNVRQTPIIEEYWILVLDKRTDSLVRKTRYEKGQQSSMSVRPSEKVLLNPFYVFLTEIRWENSSLRNFLLKCRDEFIKDGTLTKEDIASYGLYVNDLSHEELESLGVKEKDEISGFALLPVGLLLEMSRQGIYHLDPPDKTVYIYKNHIDKILISLEMSKIIRKPKGAEQ